MTSELSRVESVVRLLGSYWATAYRDARGVTDLSRTDVWALDEVARRLDEALACRAVDTVPDFGVPRWLPLVRLPDWSGAPPYGRAGTYQPAGAAYGHGTPPAAFAPVWGALAECPLVCERAGGGGRSWTDRRDYRLVDGELLFDADPGPGPLWAYEPRLDAGYTVDAFGAVGGVREPASASYGAFVRALLAAAAGDTGAGLKRLVCYAFDSPAAGDAGETVEQVTTVGGRTVVVTDAGGYAARDGGHLPAAGAAVPPGEAVDGSVAFRTFRGPQDPAPAEVHLDPGFCLTGSLTFGPGDVIAGDPAVVAAFRADWAAREAKYGLTVSRATGNRPLTQPQLLVLELLRYAVTLVDVYAPTARGSARLAVCRPVLPVHAALLVTLRAAPLATAGPAGDGGAARPPAVAAAPAVDAAPVVGYSRVSATPFGC